MNIPVVDFSPWTDPQDKAGRLRVAQEIVDAFKNVGFVYLVNHSLPGSVLDEAFDWTKRFFSLSEEDKMKAPHPEGWAVHRGYSWLGLANKHSGENHHQRLLHYLPIPAEDLEKERASRCMAHTDWSTLTLLFQDDCGGLKVEDVFKPGTFIPAAPIKNVVVVNAGDVLQMWSNGKLKPTNHRVTLPPLSDFVCGYTDALIECIPSCMSEKEPARYEPTTVADYHLMRMATLY